VRTHLTEDCCFLLRCCRKPEPTVAVPLGFQAMRTRCGPHFREISFASSHSNQKLGFSVVILWGLQRSLHRDDGTKYYQRLKA
jgi:hypothetical protein